ncbi:MAG: hypothetical protein G01um101438_321 [Parcubacteria group bacterium Gr01-1014_38]|nr:MAG: hypothetical protein G01um101438_321 [Parcubacteria group bacterium Gr01-1014_38]
MAIRTLPHLSTLLRDAFRLAWSHVGTLIALATVPFVPLLLFSPFIVQVLLAVNQGAASLGAIVFYVSSWTAVLALLGLLLGFVVSVVSTAGIFFTLAGTSDPGPRAALRTGMERWIAFVWTWLLSVFAVALSLLPGMLFFWWARIGLQPVLEGSGLSLFALIVALLLVLPAFIVASWYAFSLIPAARGDAWGSDALRISHRLVAGVTGQVFGLLFAWFLFELLFSILLNAFFPGLPLFTGFVYYYTTTILGSAYLVVIYQALRRA